MTAQTQTQKIPLIDQGKNWKLYAKTGAGMRVKPHIGWWVGWVEKDDQIYSFALNMDINDFEKDLPKRAELGREALKALELID